MPPSIVKVLILPRLSNASSLGANGCPCVTSYTAGSLSAGFVTGSVVVFCPVLILTTGGCVSVGTVTLFLTLASLFPKEDIALTSDPGLAYPAFTENESPLI